MEPETSGQSPADVGWSKRPDLREETPGEEAKGGDGNVVVLRRRGGDEAVKCKGVKFERGGGREDDYQVKTRDEEEAAKYEEELDPRIQDARSSYRKILTDSARKLNAQGSQLGACIEKARPYYEARRLAKEAQQETQKAALRYERAVSMHTAAREMVYVAEQGLLADRNTMDPTWQEMLNHATAKVNEAEEERFRSEHEHERVTQLCQDAEAKVQTLQKSLKKVILKSKPYFELKAQFNHILEEHKAKVVQLEEHVAKVKTRYSVALRNLEQISEQIHAQRGRIRAGRGRLAMCGGRSSPVGAEAETRAAIRVPIGSLVGMGKVESDWVDGEKTRLWVEKHRENGWGQREELEAERTGSDRMSIISLKTIASDLEKCDSVEHLGDFSDVGSALGDEWDWNRNRNRAELTDGPQQVRTHQQNEGGSKQENKESLVKHHHRRKIFPDATWCVQVLFSKDNGQQWKPELCYNGSREGKRS
ncbi:SH3 domain-binding protein 5-like isoform X2 [Phyllopteryx taeniolatus]|uniref:SH3 domain-binding protein 5-like isoform X2 n=1 Tax=Phyllopteryx taeniolatus TaxID=161469 RepID=UPI002AD269FC|nr:SH3 domain-binding protein 5-like isoform X2 [Phyllopteryx taeniolatus]